jgi:general secretion pathway protein B
MSFILDALKKSERERQRTAVPGINDLPVVVQSSRTSPWTTVTTVVALLAAAGFAWVWWQSPAPSPRTTDARPAPVERPSATIDAAEPVARPAPVETAALPPGTRSLASEATRGAPTRVAPTARSSTPDTGSSEAPSVTAGEARGSVTEAPMSILEARATGMSVPELTLELLVSSDDPRQRFVYINGAKYVEGDTLAEGPRVIDISAEGAVLTFNGRTFLLPQN